MSVDSRCSLTVVLLCMGRGGDPNSYRSKRDESQWWSRRDALVRCVASFLLGPGCSSRRDMILLFDDDSARAFLRRRDQNGIVATSTLPTEQNIISMFKEAAENRGNMVSFGCLQCRIEVDPILTKTGKKQASSSVLPSGMDSKRQLLEYLQQNCSIDFLRDHGLNSNPQSILKKANKNSLMEIWNKWREKHTKPDEKGSNDKVLETTFTDFIQRSKDTDTSTKTIVGTLHETGDEFPCFGIPSETTDEGDYRMILFLGAVRDMTRQENQILSKVCQTLEVPNVAIRFAKVSEFTSKILSLLAFHHSQEESFRGAIRRLLRKEVWEQHKYLVDDDGSRTLLNVICTVPLKSSQISTDLSQRDRIHWCIVRVVVCTLWRSRLASTERSIGHENALSFIFEDGVTLELNEESIVKHLATKHQAAPSEFQILSAIRSQLDTKAPLDEGWKKKKLAADVFKRMLHSSSSSKDDMATISISLLYPQDLSRKFATTSIADLANEKASPNTFIIAVLNFETERMPPENDRPTKISKMHRALLAAAENENISTVNDGVVPIGGDYEAACITCLQHFLYQNRLFTPVATKLSGKKRKK